MKKIRKPGRIKRYMGPKSYGHAWSAIAANGNPISRSTEGYERVTPRDRAIILTAKIIMYDALPLDLVALRDYATALIAERGIE